MTQYRFVGNLPLHVGDLVFDRFGQRAQFDVPLAKDVLGGGGAVIPEADFKAIGFTDAEISQYGYAGGYPEPPADFVARRGRAQAKARAYMADLDSLTDVAQHEDAH